jgi:hypothetical protein
MRFFITLVLTLICGVPAIADGGIPFSKAVNASLLFRDVSDGSMGYPHVLKVFLRLDNAFDSEVIWVADSRAGIEAELLDSSGQPVPQPPTVASIQSNSLAYILPFGSRLDWLISGGGIGMAGDANNKYAIMVGSKGWLIPIKMAGTYTLRIRLHGLSWTSNTVGLPELLLDLPPTKIEVTK